MKVDDLLETNQRIAGQMDTVGALASTFKDGLAKLEGIFQKEMFREVAENSAKSAKALQTMNKHMVTLVEKISANETPSKKPTNVKNVGIDTTAEASNPKTKSKIGYGVRNAKLFASSIALQYDKEELEKGLNCVLDVVKTYHIEKHPEAQDPEMFLKNMIDSNLKEIKLILLSL